MASKKQKRPASGSLTLLGAAGTEYPDDPAKARLEAFANPHPGRNYAIELDCPEFTSLCPITGQPDFGHISISYTPDKLCIESKALKLYLFAFRNRGCFHEDVVNRILNDLVKACKPRNMTVKGTFKPRGGIAITVTASHPAKRSRGN